MLICHKYKKVNKQNANKNQKQTNKQKTSKNASPFPVSEELPIANWLVISSPKQFRYESQLQMVQVTGSSDNEYFYVDFREYEYDLKWEFPRENLEFGKNGLFQTFPSPLLSVGGVLNAPCVLQAKC